MKRSTRWPGWMFAAALLAAVCTSAQAAQPPQARDFPVAAAASQQDVYPERRTAFPGGVTGLADITYSVLPGYRPLILDLYLPPGDTPRPLVLFVHGGGWVGGNTRHSGALADFPGVLARLASEGFVVASVEYRLAAEAQFPAQLQDVRAALRYLRDNASRYRIDPTRVAAWGGSAGGHLAALAAMTCGEAGSECLQGAVIWYGIFDFAQVVARGADGNAQKLLGCKEACTAADAQPASPLAFASADDPPMLLIHGENDRVVDVSQSRLADARLRELGVPVRTMLIPGVDHSFVGATPEVTRAATLAATNATFDFLHALFGDSKP